MRKILLSFQVIFIAVFTIALITSFIVIDRIEEQSRLLITDKVVEGTSSKIDFAEELLNSKAADKYLKDYQIEAIRNEMEAFRADPYAYVEFIIIDKEKASVIPQELETNNPLKMALYKKIYSWKQGLKSYFNKTFFRLILDIRIFLLTNIVALLIAAFICFRVSSTGSRAMALSTIITIATAFSALSYINSSWLINILLNSYAGYGYAGGIAFLTGLLYWEYTSRVSKKTG